MLTQKMFGSFSCIIRILYVHTALPPLPPLSHFRALPPSLPPFHISVKSPLLTHPFTGRATKGTTSIIWPDPPCSPHGSRAQKDIETPSVQGQLHRTKYGIQGMPRVIEARSTGRPTAIFSQQDNAERAKGGHDDLDSVRISSADVAKVSTHRNRGPQCCVLRRVCTPCGPFTSKLVGDTRFRSAPPKKPMSMSLRRAAMMNSGTVCWKIPGISQTLLTRRMDDILQGLYSSRRRLFFHRRR